jgi:predicted Zn-dependent protease
VNTVPRNHQKFQEAKARLEKSDFAGAREAYRQCFIESAPGLVGLSQLHVAEEWDPVSFRIKLCERYPDSQVLRAELASAYLRIRRPHQALDILKELVAKTRASNTRLPLLLTRFRAALAANAYDIASDDFAEIWRSGETHRPARLLRRSLLKELSTLGDPRSAPFLKKIEAHFPDEPALLRYIAAKGQELRALEQLLDLPDKRD